jgi:hypothetical protein
MYMRLRQGETPSHATRLFLENVRRRMERCHMVPLNSTWQNVGGITLALMWFGGGIALFARTLTQQFAYLRHFPPVDGVPLDNILTLLSGMRPIRAQWAAMLQKQSEPRMEAMRREVNRRFLVCLVWIYGYPFLCIGVIALLVSTNVLRLIP